MVKLGFTGVYIIFLISDQKHRLWVLVKPPRRGGSKEYPQSMFWAVWKMSDVFYLKILSFWRWNFLYICIWIGNVFVIRKEIAPACLERNNSLLLELTPCQKGVRAKESKPCVLHILSPLYNKWRKIYQVYPTYLSYSRTRMIRV